MEYHDLIFNHLLFLDVVAELCNCQEVQVAFCRRSIALQNFMHLQTIHKLHHVTFLHSHKAIECRLSHKLWF